MKNAKDLLPKILGQPEPSTEQVATTSGAEFTVVSALKHMAKFRPLDDNLIQAQTEAANFLSDMWNMQTPRCLSLLGPSGTGKSMLARLVSAFFQRYMAGIKVDQSESDHGQIWRCQGGFVDWGESLRDMCDTKDFSRMGAFKSHYFLVLDDIMAEHQKMKELSASKLFEILNARHGRRWTIVTANISLNNISEQLDPRISSRLIRDGNVVVELPESTPDYAMR